MKFDCIVMNPPYQAPSENNNKGAGNTLWNQSVSLGINLSKDNGFLSIVTPSGWRNVGGRFTETNDLLKSVQIKYLEIHNADDGLKTFGAGTRYDWYIAQNKKPTELTTIFGEDKKVYNVFLPDLDFIANGMFDEIKSLFAKNENERVEFLYDCNYHSSKKEVTSKEKTKNFINPCVQHVSAKDNNPSCIYYSRTRELGHFGISKIIFGRQISGVFIDNNGDFGMSDACAALVDKVENLENIQKAMLSKRFIELLKMCDVGGNRDRYNRKVISLFRKDFWKEFLK